MAKIGRISVDSTPSWPIATPDRRQEPWNVTRLLDLIDEYKDAHGAPSDASIARAIGAAAQTISSWRTRGYKEPMDREMLRRLADLIGQDYETVVLPAVLLDVNWLSNEEAYLAARKSKRGPQGPRAFDTA